MTLSLRGVGGFNKKPLMQYYPHTLGVLAGIHLVPLATDNRHSSRYLQISQKINEYTNV